MIFSIKNIIKLIVNKNPFFKQAHDDQKHLLAHVNSSLGLYLSDKCKNHAKIFDCLALKIESIFRRIFTKKTSKYWGKKNELITFVLC